MLLHVIWAFIEETAEERPTFSVTGVVLQWADRTPAHVRQGRFTWRHDAWEAEVEVTAGAASGRRAPGVLRVHPEVITAWASQSLNPRSEAARQLCVALQQRGWTGHLGVITLTR